MEAIKIEVSELRIGSELMTWMDKKVVLVAIRAESEFKPLVVDYNGRVQYFHYNQINEIL